MHETIGALDLCKFLGVDRSNLLHELSICNESLSTESLETSHETVTKATESIGVSEGGSMGVEVGVLLGMDTRDGNELLENSWSLNDSEDVLLCRRSAPERQHAKSNSESRNSGDNSDGTRTGIGLGSGGHIVPSSSEELGGKINSRNESLQDDSSDVGVSLTLGVGIHVEAGDDTKVALASTEDLVEIGVFSRGSISDITVGGDNLEALNVITREPTELYQTDLSRNHKKTVLRTRIAQRCS